MRSAQLLAAAFTVEQVAALFTADGVLAGFGELLVEFPIGYPLASMEAFGPALQADIAQFAVDLGLHVV